IGLVQAVISAGNVLLVYLIGRTLTGRSQSVLAAAAMAVYPYPVWHDVHAVRTCLDAAFSLASVLFLLRLFTTRRLIYGATAGVTMVAAAQTTNLILGMV